MSGKNHKREEGGGGGESTSGSKRDGPDSGDRTTVACCVGVFGRG